VVSQSAYAMSAQAHAVSGSAYPLAKKLVESPDELVR
jgi:hypothetical protein